MNGLLNAENISKSYGGVRAVEDVSLHVASGEVVAVGRELSILGILRGKKMTDETREVLQQLGVSLPDSKVPVRYLSGGQRQAVAIGRVLAWGSKVIILDEPTAALGVQESRQVLEMIKRMRADGRTIVLITHNMDHVLEVADRVIVMRRGKKVGDLAVGNIQIADIVHLIVAG